MSDIYEMMNYPFKATLKVLGEIYPHDLLDNIYIVVYINGTEHETLSGTYQILNVTDELGDSYFSTTFELLKLTTNTVVGEVENFVGNSSTGKAYAVDENLRKANTPSWWCIEMIRE